MKRHLSRVDTTSTTRSKRYRNHHHKHATQRSIAISEQFNPKSLKAPGTSVVKVDNAWRSTFGSCSREAAGERRHQRHHGSRLPLWYCGLVASFVSYLRDEVKSTAPAAVDVRRACDHYRSAFEKRTEHAFGERLQYHGCCNTPKRSRKRFEKRRDAT